MSSPRQAPAPLTRHALTMPKEKRWAPHGMSIPSRPQPGCGPHPLTSPATSSKCSAPLRGPRGAVLMQSSAREMITPVGVGPFAVGLSIDKRGEGWYFSHSGSNWGFRGDMVGHIRRGYGVALLTNLDNGGARIQEIEARVAAAYQWDSLDRPLRR